MQNVLLLLKGDFGEKIWVLYSEPSSIPHKTGSTLLSLATGKTGSVFFHKDSRAEETEHSSKLPCWLPLHTAGQHKVPELKLSKKLMLPYASLEVHILKI